MTDSSARTHGILYIVATPIGNRDDLSFRALKILQSVDLILAEDTRHSMPLLTGLGIQKPMMSFHAHNEAHKSDDIIDKLKQGASIALISDAGTPLISDPGFPLVSLALKNHIAVVPIPGPCALITALSGAGVSSDTFTFCGFLPAKHSSRLKKLQSLKSIEHTLVFYESTHRIEDSLNDLITVFDETCELVLAKELTKTFERFVRGSCQEVKEWLLADPNHLKGEFVLILPPRTLTPPPSIDEHLLSVLLTELPLKQAVKLASQLSETHKNDLYKLALTLQERQ